ncbi:uncharacterized protein LOC117324371 [Pecten maximus]|uniref:uncharacterized protein LOC117324371 n=1 Tax=Pecten maximus TaxID=6579 RepID=UPI00145817E3|nr:uncharacterized protein LOC117324371 [Pecten maximus]
MEPNHQVLGVYADALTTLIKNHDLTKTAMKFLRNNFQLFADKLKAQVQGIDVIQVGSSYDDLHLARLLKSEEGSYQFFPEVDFDFDMIYLSYVVGETDISGTREGDADCNGQCLPSSTNLTGSSLGDSGKVQQPFAVMESSSCPGYVKLRVTPHGRQMLKKPGCRIGNFITPKGYLLNTAFTSGLVNEGGRTEIVYSRVGQFVTDVLQKSETTVYTKTGPAITEINKACHGYTYDFVHAFPCSTWPTVAKGWADRARRCQWPNDTLIQNIVRDGCLLVAIGSQQTSDSSEEWRLSFVQAERMLSDSLSNLQKTCYSVVKVMLKSSLSERSILTSYHMKNIFYYLCEEVATSPRPGHWSHLGTGSCNS